MPSTVGDPTPVWFRLQSPPGTNAALAKITTGGTGPVYGIGCEGLSRLIVSISSRIWSGYPP